MTDITDAEIEAMAAQFRVEREYVTRLKAVGLWPGTSGIEHYQRKMQIQQDIYRDYPDVDLPMFALEKAETRLHAEELARQWCREHGGEETLTAEEFWSAVWSRPNHDRDNPDLLLTLIEEGCLTPAAMRELIADVWTSTEFPGANGGVDRWRDAFDIAGWISDDESERPTEPLTLYRGAVPEYQRGMSWTLDPERAVWFAKRFMHGNDAGLVYRRTFGPREILARFTGRGEDEYVVWIESDDDTEQDWADPND
jgi:hypothetical protein